MTASRFAPKPPPRIIPKTPTSDLGRVLETFVPPASDGPPDLGNLKVGETYVLPTSVFKESDLNARVIYVGSEVDEMSISLKENKQSVPVIGFVSTDESSIIIVDGQKRLRGARGAGIETLRVEICEPQSAKQQYLTSHRINTQRSCQTVFDDAIRFKQLLGQGVFSSQAELARELELHETKVSRIIGLNSIPEALMRRMREHESLSGLTSASAVARMFGGDQPMSEDDVEEFIEKAISQKWSANEIEKAVDHILSENGGRKKRAPRGDVNTVFFSGQKGLIKTNAARGQLTFAISGLNADVLTSLQNKIREVLEQSSDQS